MHTFGSLPLICVGAPCLLCDDCAWQLCAEMGNCDPGVLASGSRPYWPCLSCLLFASSLSCFFFFFSLLFRFSLPLLVLLPVGNECLHVQLLARLRNECLHVSAGAFVLFPSSICFRLCVPSSRHLLSSRKESTNQESFLLRFHITGRIRGFLDSVAPVFSSLPLGKVAFGKSRA